MSDLTPFIIPLSLIRIIIRLLNGLFTISFFPFLYRLYKRSRRRFYLLWGIGFLLYGINITIRALWDTVTISSPVTWISFFFYMTGFIFIITGIGDLVEQTKIALASSLLLPLVPLIGYYITSPEILAWTASLSPFILISISLFFIRRKYHASLDLFITGWLLLLVVNIALASNMVNLIFVDVFAICGKFVILIGMISPKFSFLVDDMKRYLISGTPTEYPSSIQEHFILVKIETSEKYQEYDWISDKVKENIKQGIRTILIVLYDLITPSELRSRGLEENDLYFVRMSPSRELKIQSIEDNTALMSDHLSQLDLLISEIIEYSEERKIRCDIILYTLTWVIHTHGWDNVYRLLISKIPELKKSNAQIYAVYYPETHNVEEISKFERIADKILNFY